MKKSISFLLIICAAFFFAGCTPKEKPVASVKILVGSATLVHNGKTSPLEVSNVLIPGDSIQTAEGATAVVSFGDFLDVEIQQNALFTVAQYSDTVKKLSLEKGNLWIRVNRKLSKNDQLSLVRPTTVASVRGTQFYSFEIEGMSGTCECEGKISMDGTRSNDEVIQLHDTITLSKNKKMIVFSEKDLAYIFGEKMNHNHSAIDNSPLGKKSGGCMTAAVKKKYIELAQKKFNEIK